MRSKSHQFDILWRAVLALAIHDRPLKHVAELSSRAKIIGPHKVDHAPILEQVVLQWIARQHHPTPALHTLIKQQVPSLFTN